MGHYGFMTALRKRRTDYGPSRSSCLKGTAPSHSPGRRRQHSGRWGRRPSRRWWRWRESPPRQWQRTKGPWRKDRPQKPRGQGLHRRGAHDASFPLMEPAGYRPQNASAAGLASAPLELEDRPTRSRTASSFARRTAAFPDGRIERCVEAVRLARVRLGRGLLLGLPERPQNRRSNELRQTARTGGSNPLQAIRQLVVHLFKE